MTFAEYVPPGDRELPWSRVAADSPDADSLRVAWCRHCRRQFPLVPADLLRQREKTVTLWPTPTLDDPFFDASIARRVIPGK
ncbi:hypothetical protein [Fodinicola feengrottensis]|uniref:hypothetical protein n=1 Tax=Fodinicola feengrottensis TaxID=435914 RepID=UPI0013D66CFB|nr:hypothetical protein [Fodinicola feengrottensis]